MFPRDGIPQLHCLVQTSNDKRSAVWTEDCAQDRTSIYCQRVKMIPRNGIPQLYGLIATSTCKPFCVWTERYAIDCPRMPGEYVQMFPSDSIPNSYRNVRARRSQDPLALASIFPSRAERYSYLLNLYARGVSRDVSPFLRPTVELSCHHSH